MYIFCVQATYGRTSGSNKFIRTSEIENVFKEQEGCVITFEGLLSSEHAGLYTIAEPHNAALELGVDQGALLRGKTLLYFKNGEYAGSSKTDLATEVPWLLRLVQ